MDRKDIEPDVIQTDLRGRDLLSTPVLNKGEAFTEDERKDLGLRGLLPPAVLPLEQQVKRAYEQYKNKKDDLQKNIYLSEVRDMNDVLFYRLLSENIKEMLPVVYTPVISEAIEEYSHDYRRPHGVYLSINDPDGIEEAFKNYTARFDDIELVVATDGEGILGIGDWGVGGIDIALGKLTVYTGVAGIDPRKVIPVMLDTGTNQERLLNDPFYIGNKHSRVRGKAYDEFIDKYVKTVNQLFPGAILHWEDFATENGSRLLEKYQDDMPCFNDDIQGTGAIATAAFFSAADAMGQNSTDQQIVIFGAGTAGMGIADQIYSAMKSGGLSEEEARGRFWCIDEPGLLTEGMEDLSPEQKKFARSENDLKNHDLEEGAGLLEVVKSVKPTVLIGTSGVGGAFSEKVVKAMAKNTERPAIFPLSNPDDKAEAVPRDLLEWTEGRALIATGSPFDPVEYDGVTYTIGQANNAFVFPGLGLGAIVAGAERMTKKMLEAAGEGVAKMVKTHEKGAPLLPETDELKTVSAAVAVEVVKAALEEGIASKKVDDPIQAVQDAMWDPEYPVVKSIKK